MNNFVKLAIAVGFLLSLNGMDYQVIGDIFRDGKIRYLFLLLTPISFFYFKKQLTWAPALFGALAIASFTVNNYQLFSCFPLIVILATLSCAAFIVDELTEAGFGNILVLTGTFQAAIALLQFSGIHLLFVPLNAEDMHTPIGTQGHETVLGPLLVACLCPALWRKNYICASLMTAAAIATFSSMTWAALGAAYLVFFWHFFSFKFTSRVAALGCFALAGFYAISPHAGVLSFHGRFFIWPFGLRAIKEAPYFGSGIGSWVNNFLPLYKDEILAQFRFHLPRQLHCDYLDFAVEYGLIPFAALLTALFQFIRSFKPTWQHAICASILVNAAANFPLCLVPTALIFVVSWAHTQKHDIISIEETHA